MKVDDLLDRVIGPFGDSMPLKSNWSAAIKSSLMAGAADFLRAALFLVWPTVFGLDSSTFLGRAEEIAVFLTGSLGAAVAVDNEALRDDLVWVLGAGARAGGARDRRRDREVIFLLVTLFYNT